LPKYATVDLGTNSVLLLIADVDGAETKIVDDRATITRIGRGVDETGRLADDAAQRTLAVLEEYAGAIRDAGVDGVKAVGTSALRDAEGADAFVAKATEVLGTPLEVISGEREAELTWKSIAREFGSVRAVVVDVGGGSTEVIVGSGDRVERSVSLRLGSVRMLERLVKNDPPSHVEWDAVMAEIDRQFADLPELEDDIRAFGVAGTVTTVAALAQELPAYDRDRVHGFALEHYHIAGLEAQLLVMTADERRDAFPALDPKRADVIPIGAHILMAFLEKYQLEEITVADLGVRFGLLAELVG